MAHVRQPAVSGTFYTEDAQQLRRQINGFLAGARVAHHTPKAVIAPHAGYIYSGPIAGSAYAAVQSLRERITRVVLIGPAHRVRVSGVAASSAQAFATPLGAVPVAQEMIRTLVAELDFLVYMDEAHAPEHSLEVHLPFLQTVLHAFSLMPFAAGNADPDDIERLLERLWGGPETLIVISSDLSHYHYYDDAKRLDRYTTRHIESLDPATLSSEHACGQIPICGLLQAASRHRLKVETLDVRNSGDTAGPRNQVVGYGAYSFYDPSPGGAFDDTDRSRLSDIARESIKHGLEHGKALAVRVDEWPQSLRSLGASFVTLKKRQTLRGCIGNLEASRPLVEDVAENAYAAAFRDPRFPALTEKEFDQLEIGISVLSRPETMTFHTQEDLIDQLRPGVDGLILTDGIRRGTFLPSVWENIPDRRNFIEQLKRKVGLDAEYWSNKIRVERYTT